MRQISLTPSETRSLYLGGALLDGEQVLLNVITGINKMGKYVVVSGWDTFDAPSQVRVKVERRAKAVPTSEVKAGTFFDWVTSEDLRSYAVESYMGVEQNDSGKQQRVFLYVEDGKMWQGNTRAFYEHLSRKFDFPLTTHGHVALNMMLREMGYPARDHERHGQRLGGKVYPPQVADARVCGSSDED